MPDWREMYMELFAEISKAIDLLQKAQNAAEEIYISSPETIVRMQTGKEDESADTRT